MTAEVMRLPRKLMETVIRPLQRPAEAKGLQLMLEIDPAVRLSLPRGSRQVSLNGVGLRAIRALQG